MIGRIKAFVAREVQGLIDATRGALGKCDHGFTMHGDGIVVSRDLEVVMLAKRLRPHGSRLRYQIRCRCCKEIVARKDYEHMEVLGI